LLDLLSLGSAEAYIGEVGN